MKFPIRQTLLSSILSHILFILLFGVTVVAAGVVSLGFIGPNIAAVANILVPVLIAAPLAYILFFILFLIKRVKWYVRCFLPVFVFPLIFGVAFGWTMYERDPENMFRVFVSSPIPEGVSNIRAQDITIGIDTEIVLTFNITPQALDEIVVKHDLELAENHLEKGSAQQPEPCCVVQDESPQAFFPDVKWTEAWTLYSKCTEQSCIEMWVDPNQSTALYHYWAF